MSIISNNGLQSQPLPQSQLQANDNLVWDANGNLTGIAMTPSSITVNCDSHGNLYTINDGTTIQMSGDLTVHGQLDHISTNTYASYSYVTIETIKSQYTPDELIEAYGIEEFENAIRKKKLKRLMDKDE